MILASWNVNSIGVRLPLVIDWLKETKVDVLCIQETKCVDEKFPKDDFLAIGYQSAYFGQKTYNGVAIVSRSDIAAVETNFPGIPKPEQARFVKAEIESVTILNSYIPNGSEPGSDKFEYKMAFLEALGEHLNKSYSKESRLLLCGDFNIAPLDIDVYDPDKTRGQILVSDDERDALAKLKGWGFVDGFRQHVEEGGTILGGTIARWPSAGRWAIVLIMCGFPRVWHRLVSAPDRYKPTQKRDHRTILRFSWI